MTILSFAARLGRVACVLAIALGSSTAAAQLSAQQCGPLKEGRSYGPYDYRTDKDKLGVVEQFHFNAGVEALIRGQQSVNIGSDLDYVLRAFPNHHRALMSLMRLGVKLKSRQPVGLRYVIECYFERAIRFTPADTIVRMLYAQFLAGDGRLDSGVHQLDLASQLAGDDPFTNYNLGLVYFDLKQYDKSLRHAHKAMELGLPRTELREQLLRVGQWIDPPKDATRADAMEHESNGQSGVKH